MILRGRLVVDASVVIKWLPPEEGREQATALLGARLMAPDLLHAECMNAIWVGWRRKEILSEEAEQFLRRLATLPLTRLFHFSVVTPG